MHAASYGSLGSMLDRARPMDLHRENNIPTIGRGE